MLSEKVQLEQLTNEKACVEEESRRLEEEQKQLETRARGLLEKIIQELRKKNSEKKQANSKLQLKVDSLRAQLSDLSGSSVPPSPAKEENVETGGETPDTGENVTISIIEDEIEAAEPIQEGKKRKFF
jgi:peptidoglycan hydrolase CwlO-like protein